MARPDQGELAHIGLPKDQGLATAKVEPKKKKRAKKELIIIVIIHFLYTSPYPFISYIPLKPGGQGEGGGGAKL